MIELLLTMNSRILYMKNETYISILYKETLILSIHPRKYLHPIFL